MNTNNSFDSDEVLQETDSEESFEKKVTLTRNQLDKPLNDLMRYAAGLARNNESDGFSYSEFAEKTTYDSHAAEVAQLLKDGFLDLEFFATEALDADDERIEAEEIPQIGFNTIEEYFEVNLRTAEEQDVDYTESKGAVPRTEDAALSIGEIGKKYLQETEIGYSGEQAVEAYERSGPIGAEPVDR